MIRPRACWGAACDLLGMSVVYPAGVTVTISKKSPLIRILSKGRDCIDFEKMLKRGFVGGGVLDAPRRGQRLAAHNERRQFASRTRSCGCLPRRGKHCSLPSFASLNRGPALATPQPFPANPLKNGDAAINLRAGHTRPLQGGAFEVAMKTIYRFCTFPGSW